MSVANTAKASAPAESDERVVRVTAQSLSRLMGLAGESLVEARWLQPFAQSLLILKRQQDCLVDVFEEMARVVPQDGDNYVGLELLREAHQAMLQCRAHLAGLMPEFGEYARRSDDLNSRLYNEVITSRMRPFGDGVQGFPRMIRDLARELGKQVRYETQRERTPVDRDVLDKLDAPLNHLLRNAINHGLEAPQERIAAGKLETGRLRLEASYRAGMLAITISDDGRGIDLEQLKKKIVERRLTSRELAARMSPNELLEFLFLPGFSTRDEVTEISGRGVGLDVLHSQMQALGGSVRIQTHPGRGTSFHLHLPITLSVIRAVLVEIGGEPFAFPHNRIDWLLRLPCEQLVSLEDRQYFVLDGCNVGTLLAGQVFRTESKLPPGDLFVVLFSRGVDQCGLLVDDFRGEQDLVVRPLDPRLGKVPNMSSAAILADGSPVLIVDVDDLDRSIERLLTETRLSRADAGERQRRLQRVLVVDDSLTVREAERHLLAAKGYDVSVAVDGMDGWNTLNQETFDPIVSDVDMPRMNGIELATRIKADPGLKRIPVVIVSYKDREEDRLRGLEAGADYYLTKGSFHDESFLRAVHDLIGEA